MVLVKPIADPLLVYRFSAWTDTEMDRQYKQKMRIRKEERMSESKKEALNGG